MKTLPPNLVADICRIATTAGEFISRERKTFSFDRVEQKGLNDLVSHVDKTAEKIITDGLLPLLPGAGFIVEENTLSNRSDYNWIVDPLDGTTNFIHGIPSYAVSIGLEHNGVILAGVVLEVSRNELFHAEKGKGAFLNGERIAVSNRATVSESLLATGFPVQEFSRLDGFVRAITHFMKNSHGIRRIGAASVDMCYVACGRLDGFFEYNLKPWDVAAGALIVSEAGGIVTDFSGGGNWLFGKEMCCSNHKIAKEFLAVVHGSFDTKA